jgi:hypothetical protein
VDSEGAPARTTVVIPAWGAYVGERLQKALASIASQERPVSVLVVDNAAEETLSVPDHVEVVRSEQRLSLGAARNLGLARVQTPEVMFWDADDTMLPGTLAFLEEALENDSRLVAFGAAIIESPSGVRHRWPRRWIGLVVRFPVLLALLDAVWSVFPTTGATLIHTDAAKQVGGFSDADSGEDWGFGVALTCRGRCGWSERPGRLYVQHAGSMWSTHAGVADQLQHAAIVRERLRRPGVAPEWLRRLLPLIAVAQWGAVAAHMMVAAVRRLGRR